MQGTVQPPSSLALACLRAPPDWRMVGSRTKDRKREVARGEDRSRRKTNVEVQQAERHQGVGSLQLAVELDDGVGDVLQVQPYKVCKQRQRCTANQGSHAAYLLDGALDSTLDRAVDQASDDVENPPACRHVPSRYYRRSHTAPAGRRQRRENRTYVGTPESVRWTRMFESVKELTANEAVMREFNSPSATSKSATPSVVLADAEPFSLKPKMMLYATDHDAIHTMQSTRCNPPRRNPPRRDSA